MGRYAAENSGWVGEGRLFATRWTVALVVALGSLVVTQSASAQSRNFSVSYQGSYKYTFHSATGDINAATTLTWYASQVITVADGEVTQTANPSLVEHGTITETATGQPSVNCTLSANGPYPMAGKVDEAAEIATITAVLAEPKPEFNAGGQLPNGTTPTVSAKGNCIAPGEGYFMENGSVLGNAKVVALLDPFGFLEPISLLADGKTWKKPLDVSAHGSYAGTTSTISITSFLSANGTNAPPPDLTAGLAALPATPEHSTPQNVRAAALGAIPPALQWAIYPCLTTATGGVLFATSGASPVGTIIGGSMVVAGAPLCASLVKILADAVHTYDDPPVSDYTQLARLSGTRSALALPSCSKYPTETAFCSKLESDLQTVAEALDTTEGAADALATTVGRESAAASAGDEAALALQQANALKLLPTFKSDLAAASNAGTAVAALLRSSNIRGVLTPALSAKAATLIRGMLSADGASHADQTLILGSVSKAAAVDLAETFARPLD